MSKIINGILIIEENETLNESQFADNYEIEEIVLPQSLVEIPDQCFTGCDNLRKITMPANLKVIGNGAFTLDSKLSDVTLNEGLEVIGAGAFSDCSSLTKIEIPDSVKEICEMAFYTASLKRINLGKNVQYIGEDAFWGNEKLKEVYILNPDVVIKNCFGSCYNLTEGFVATGYPEEPDDFSITLYTILGLSTFDKHSSKKQDIIKQMTIENQNIIMERILKSNNTKALNTMVKEKLIINDIQPYLDFAFENKQNEIIALLLSCNDEEEDFTL